MPKIPVLGNPLTSEAAAFRWLVMIAVAAAIILIVALAVGSLAGFVLLLALVGAGVGFAVRRWVRRRRHDTSAEQS